MRLRPNKKKPFINNYFVVEDIRMNFKFVLLKPFKEQKLNLMQRLLVNKSILRIKTVKLIIPKCLNIDFYININHHYFIITIVIINMLTKKKLNVINNQ